MGLALLPRHHCRLRAAVSTGAESMCAAYLSLWAVGLQTVGRARLLRT